MDIQHRAASCVFYFLGLGFQALAGVMSFPLGLFFVYTPETSLGLLGVLGWGSG
ncbi:hypothetical protein DL95DRAFT_182810 [Leptodontidium sp. 2 PMI_412]|nr:hypothetical protein DL95DRAFT_182810 [Leptodontidium sp. 2 PMI_412]